MCVFETERERKEKEREREREREKERERERERESGGAQTLCTDIGKGCVYSGTSLTRNAFS